MKHKMLLALMLLCVVLMIACDSDGTGDTDKQTTAEVDGSQDATSHQTEAVDGSQDATSYQTEEVEEQSSDVGDGGHVDIEMYYFKNYAEFMQFGKTGIYDSAESNPPFYVGYQLVDYLPIDVKSLLALPDSLEADSQEYIVVYDVTYYCYQAFPTTGDVKQDCKPKYSIYMTYDASGDNSIKNDAIVSVTAPKELTNKSGIFKYRLKDGVDIYYRKPTVDTYKGVKLSFGHVLMDIVFEDAALTSAQIKERYGERVAALFSAETEDVELAMTVIIDAAENRK